MHYIILIIFIFSCMMNLHATELPVSAEAAHAAYTMKSSPAKVGHTVYVAEQPLEIIHVAHVTDSLAADSLIVESLIPPPPRR